MLRGRQQLNVTRLTEQLNSPVQGTSADLLKLAAAQLWQDRAAMPSALPGLCIHDEITLECDAVEAEAVAAWLTGHMRAAGEAILPEVPAAVEVTIDTDWSGQMDAQCNAVPA